MRDLLVHLGALREGHFVLTSGRHADRFFLLARLFEQPPAAAWIGAALAERVREAGWGPVDAVVGPAMGGILLAYEVARHLGARAMFAEKGDEPGTMRLRRGFRLAPRERVLAVEDVLTTGGSVHRALSAAEAEGARVVGVAAVVRRGRHTLPFAHPTVALLADDARDWPPEACPLCRAGEAAVRPKEA
ncbi:MAG: orotate phosphoribosyltransferase [Firmicutes bacterium]|nr:orotate phosphoribosyltransferase [Bacillota bacterium]